MTGIEGRMYQPLAAAVIAAMAASLVLALTLVPVAAGLRPAAAAPAAPRDVWLMRGDQAAATRRCSTACLRHAGLVRVADAR